MLEFGDVSVSSEATQVFYLLSAFYLVLLLGLLGRSYLAGSGRSTIRHPFVAAGIVVAVALATLMGVAFGMLRPGSAISATGTMSIEDMHRATDVNSLPDRTVAVPF